MDEQKVETSHATGIFFSDRIGFLPIFRHGDLEASSPHLIFSGKDLSHAIPWIFFLLRPSSP
ncbi:uncharacterized protein DS421_10g312250 [Arachis hypogaea]|nr:uncharacterized protein DS421_10g312250 [Arachis hypogaea]